MAERSLRLWVLAVCTLSAVVAFSASEMIFTEDDVVLSDGKAAHVSLVSDEDCEFQEDITTLDDGTTSKIFKDFEAGKSALQLSNEPDVCYIRDIPKQEVEDRNRKCHNGVVLVQPDKPLPEAQTYAAGQALNVSNLTPELAEYCGDRRIVSLVIQELSKAENQKRLSSRCIRQVRQECKKELCCCQDVCTKWGWWTGSNNCKRWEAKHCSTTEVCKDVITQVGC